MYNENICIDWKDSVHDTIDDGHVLVQMSIYVDKSNNRISRIFSFDAYLIGPQWMIDVDWFVLLKNRHSYLSKSSTYDLIEIEFYVRIPDKTSLSSTCFPWDAVEQYVHWLNFAVDDCIHRMSNSEISFVSYRAFDVNEYVSVRSFCILFDMNISCNDKVR